MSERAREAAIVEPELPGFVSRGMPSLGTRSPEWEPDVDARLARVGTRIWIGADVLFFAAWYFAFFYLRSLNNNMDWLPDKTTHPGFTVGAIIVALAIVSAGLYWAGARAIAASPSTGRLLLWLALIAGILAGAAQIYEFKHLGFFPQLGGGYPSVFVGLKSVWLLQLIAALIWLATHIAQARPGGDVAARPRSAATFGNFMIFLAAIGLVSYIVLYLVV